MFASPQEKFIVEVEIDGQVVFREEWIAAKFERERGMLRRKAEREAQGRPWAIFILKQRIENTKESLRKIPKNIKRVA